MKRSFVLPGVLLAGSLLVACTEMATDAEIGDMCAHQIELAGEFDSTPAEERVAKVSAEYDLQIKDLDAKKAEALQAVDADRDTKLAAAAKDEEKAAITAEAEAAKTAKTAEFQAQLDKLNADKAAAEKQVAQKAQEDADAKKAAVDKCVAEAKATGLAKELVQCRSKAAATEDYWKCQ